MRIFYAAILASTVLAVAGCSGGSSAKSTNGDTASKSTKCESLVGKPGPEWSKVVDGPGCTEGNTLLMSASYDCKDGSKLIWFGQGSTWYYGLSTEPLQSGSTDPSSTGHWPDDNPKYKNCLS